MNIQRVTGGVAIVVAALLVMGGCTSQSTKSVMSSQKAWDSVRRTKMAGTILDSTLSFLSNANGGRGGSSTNIASLSERYWTEAKNAMASEPPTEALDEMIDELSQELASQLPHIEEIKQSEYQVILAIGSVTNQFENAALDNVLASIESRLRQNEAVSDSFLIITTDTENAASVVHAISGNTQDFDSAAQNDGQSAGFKQYDPRYVYSLTGQLTRIDDPVNHKIQLALQLDFNHLLDKRKIKPFRFERSYYWQPYTMQWINEGEEQARRRTEALTK